MSKKIKLEILYEDNHLIAVNKPGGMLVHGDITGDVSLDSHVKEYIKKKYKKAGDVFLGVIHRLDRPVSGTIVFARTSKALTRMNKLFQDKRIKKKYLAITEIRPSNLSAVLVHYLIKDHNKNVSKAFEEPHKKYPKAKRAELEYALIGGISGYNLLEINLMTGRPHQIRVQLSKIGSPIKGDIKYGYPVMNKSGKIHLHCRSLTFVHPVKKEEIMISSKPSNNQVWQLFREYF